MGNIRWENDIWCNVNNLFHHQKPSHLTHAKILLQIKWGLHMTIEAGVRWQSHLALPVVVSMLYSLRDIEGVKNLHVLPHITIWTQIFHAVCAIWKYVADYCHLSGFYPHGKVIKRQNISGCRVALFCSSAPILTRNNGKNSRTGQIHVYASYLVGSEHIVST